MGTKGVIPSVKHIATNASTEAQTFGFNYAGATLSSRRTADWNAVKGTQTMVEKIDIHEKEVIETRLFPIENPLVLPTHAYPY